MDNVEQKSKFTSLDVAIMAITQRHEVEIAALRSAYDRLNDRIEKIETKLAIS